MKLIVGLGNPGTEYRKTRHNTGFIAVDQLVENWAANFTEKPKFHGQLAEATIKTEKVLLLKPSTFYNESGRAVRAVIDFYKLTPKEVLVIHDDLALPFGLLRVRLSGSDAGNNGVKNITAHIGEHYSRIRVGIWNERREKTDASNFVLGAFLDIEYDTLKTLCDQIESMTEAFSQGKLAPSTETIGES